MAFNSVINNPIFPDEFLLNDVGLFYALPSHLCFFRYVLVMHHRRQPEYWKVILLLYFTSDIITMTLEIWNNNFKMIIKFDSHSFDSSQHFDIGIDQLSTSNNNKSSCHTIEPKMIILFYLEFLFPFLHFLFKMCIL